MGWHINLVRNTVKINSGIALDLYNCEAEVCYSWKEEYNFPMLGGIIEDGKLVFNSDHMEHMDYLWETEVQEVLKKHKVKGDICFSSNDGDNKGQKWGYRFDGEGGMILLKGIKGKTNWVEVAPKTKKSKVPAVRDEMKIVRDAVEQDDLDYVMRNNAFNKVKNKEFHQLRRAYLEASRELNNFINAGVEEE